MKALIERVEGATGPNRELDADIACAANARPNWAVTSPESLVVDGHGRISLGKSGPGWEVRNYTGSIDAALTLIPEGAAWAVTNCKDGVPLRADFTVSSAAIDADGYETRCSAATPALALCAAALKARAQSTGENGHG